MKSEKLRVTGGHQILLLEDNYLARRHIARLLEPLNVGITSVTDSRDQFDRILAENDIDLVVIDSDIPGLDIPAVSKRLHNNNDKSLPFIVLSSLTGDKEIEHGFEVGAAAFVDKDEAGERLAEVVDRVLCRKTFRRERLVLVVDDSLVIRKMVGQGLQKNNFQVMWAENGRRALELIDHTRPDLILSDIDMPEMDGFDLCEKVKTDPELTGIPFVVMSTHDEEFHLQRMVHLGAAAYIVKPFSAEELNCLIEQTLFDEFQHLRRDKEILEAEHHALLATITSLAAALEARDPYTRGHSESVAAIISGMLSLAGDNDTNNVQMIKMAGQLHDIGKIGIRDHILLKPGKLSREEFTIIKTHPSIGAQILAPIPSLADIIPLVAQHHERFDGKGYPAGLKGGDIHPWARMTAVADTYDALTSDRHYRQGMAEDKALQIIEDVRGSQLCPDSVDLFFTWKGKNEELRVQSEECRVLTGISDQIYSTHS